jgi:FkbM family methyltransferase
VKSIKINGKILEMKVLTDADESVFNEIFIEKEYRVLDGVIKNAKSLILDIGAHIGFFSIYASVINPNVQIMAFEPDERNFLLLKENLKLNHIKNVTVKNVAVWGNLGTHDLFLSEDSHNNSLCEFLPNKSGLTKSVNTTTLEKILTHNKKCDLVKMDCEGSEEEILKNTNNSTFDKIENFYLEYHDYLGTNLKENLKKVFNMNGFGSLKTTPSSYDKRFGFIEARRKL